jgi:hypothetical protein
MGIESGVAIITLICSGFYWLIIKPLRDSILDLARLIKEMRADLKEESEKRQGVEIRLSVAEDSLKNAHHRLSKIEDEIK